MMMTTVPDEAPATIKDSMSAERKIALGQLLGADTPGPGLPPLWHWTYFWETPPQSVIGADGHPRVGFPAPPARGLRRMFAGGRVITHHALELDRPATLTRTAGPVRTKQGRSGALRFVTVTHEYRQHGRAAVVEERDIVYRDAAPAEGPPVLQGEPHVEKRVDVSGSGMDLEIDEAFLFRFSALTYNGHRIHYDLGWAAREGYGGLVVHGPLQAMLMGEHLRRSDRTLQGRVFSYRLKAPVIGTQRISVRDGSDVGVDATCAVLDARGNVTATADVHPLSSTDQPPRDNQEQTP